ncbi:MAG: hypothetical protein WBB07_15835 [Mycobacterium sp.]
MTQSSPVPGWYPKGDGSFRYWDGTTWRDAPPTPDTKPKLNAFFVMLAVLSALPTAFFGLGYVLSEAQSNIHGFLFLWSAAWTYVWWSLRHR